MRASLLAAAVAQRDQVLADLDDEELRLVARRAWRELIDRLESGGTYRLRRAELAARHPVRRQGRLGDLLVLDGDELRDATARHRSS